MKSQPKTNQKDKIFKGSSIRAHQNAMESTRRFQTELWGLGAKELESKKGELENLSRKSGARLERGLKR